MHYPLASSAWLIALCRQRDYLEKTVADLKSKLAMEATNHGREQHKALQVRPCQPDLAHSCSLIRRSAIDG